MSALPATSQPADPGLSLEIPGSGRALTGLPGLVTAASLRRSTLRPDDRRLLPAAAPELDHHPAPDSHLLPLPAGLTNLLPERGLRRGRTLQINGSTSLLLTLLGSASATGAWCAAVGLPTLGTQAARACGVDLARLALVPTPGDRWPEVVAALIDAIDVIAIAPPSSVSAALTRRLSARARERSTTLLIVGPSDLGSTGAGSSHGPSHRFPGHRSNPHSIEQWASSSVDAALSTDGGRWSGLGDGHGHLQQHTLSVLAQGRRVGGRSRHGVLHLDAMGRIAHPPDPPALDLRDEYSP
jgi:hypothetical protein